MTDDPAVRVAKCRSCEAPVWWGTWPSGARAPIDLEPVEDGTVVIVGHNHTGPLIDYAPADEQLELVPRTRYSSHFATCKDADEWRKK